MEYNHNQRTSGFDSSSYSAVLQEIYQQAQKEIDDRNRNLTAHYNPLRVPDVKPFSSPSYIDNCVIDRCEPTVDPALSFISNILAEDDEPALNHPFLSSEELFAKASEVAAILKEDSPALTLKFEADSPLSPEDGNFSPLSDDSYLDSMGGLQYLDMDLPFSVSTTISTFSESARNEFLLNSLRGPVNQPIASTNLPHMQFPEASTGSKEISVNGGAFRTIKMGSQDDIGLRMHGQKPQRSEKGGKVLKPRKENSVAHKRPGRSRSSKEGDQECVELNDLLLQCAYAVGINNIKRAMEILKKVRQYANIGGNGAERLAYYFSEAMDARFSGTGWQLYLGHLKRRATASEILKSIYMYMEHCPFVGAYHYFINQTIMNVAQRASKLHILELQIDGFQYPALFKELAKRPGGPPEVHIIGLGFPHYSMRPAGTEVVLDTVQRLGRKLEAVAASHGVPFHYTAWAGVREDLCMQDFVSPFREAGEVLVIISASLLRYVMDETLDSPILRSRLLKQGRDLNPEVYVQGIVTGSYSTPFFTRRFKEALFHFESVFDMLDTFIDKENADRLVFESEILGKAILNIVACEGSEVVDRIDRYKHWQLVTEEVGFQQLPLDQEIKEAVRNKLESRHKEYTVSVDNQYLLMGWKGRMLHAMSTWMATPERL